MLEILLLADRFLMLADREADNVMLGFGFVILAVCFFGYQIWLGNEKARQESEWSWQLWKREKEEKEKKEMLKKLETKRDILEGPKQQDAFDAAVKLIMDGDDDHDDDENVDEPIVVQISKSGEFDLLALLNDHQTRARILKMTSLDQVRELKEELDAQS